MPTRDYKTASDDVLDSLEALAHRVRDELVKAGLPLLDEDNAEELAGAVIEVDRGADEGGGVFLRWEPSPELADLEADAVASGEFENPAIAHSGLVAEAMRDAMAAILRSAKLVVDNSDDELRPFTLHVRADSA